MTNKEAIKYLQQIYPYGGHCWLDKQRTEAIGMAVKALQEEPVSEQNLSNVQRTVKNWKEDPVSGELEEAANKWDAEASFNPFYMALDDNGNPYEVRQDYTTHADSFKAGTQWKEKQMMAKAIDGTARPDDNEIWCNLASSNLKDGDKVKVIVIKED